MESRRVILLTEGYTRGWLKFEYPQKTSALREEFLLQHMERQMLKELDRDSLIVHSNMASSVPGKESFNLISRGLNRLKGLALPYLEGKSTMAKEPSRKDIKADLASWRAFLTKKNQEPAQEEEEIIPPMPVES